MLQQRGHWLRYVLGHEPQDLCARINESLGYIVREHLVAACDRLSAALRADAGALPQAGALESEPESLTAWQGLAALTLTQKGEWRKLIDFMNRLHCDHVVLEFAFRGYEELKYFRDELDERIGLGIGVIDIKVNTVETPEIVAQGGQRDFSPRGSHVCAGEGESKAIIAFRYASFCINRRFTTPSPNAASMAMGTT